MVAIATLPDFRGRGLARTLMAHAAAEAKKDGAKAFRLFANPANSEAMDLYRSLGFAPLTMELRKALD
ncbi:putative acetyltransferase [compost metagenome]